MRFALVFLFLVLIGGLLINYSINSRDLIQWDKIELERVDQVDPLLELERVIKQEYQIGNLSSVIDWNSIIIFQVGIFLVVLGFIAGGHIIIDKLFFKKFYEDPEVVMAIKRGLFYSIYPLIIVVLSIYNYVNLLLFFVILLMLIGLDYLTTPIFKSIRKKRIQIQKNEQK